MTDRPQVMDEKCTTCVFRPGDLMRLGPGRLAEIVEANLRAGAALICHKTLPYGSHPELGQSVCRGFFDAYRDRCGAIQIMDRLGVEFVEVQDPPG
ncbi:MAG: hypothetical protein ACRDRO_21495 [Pseudonocardiaceae bacterium]